jgi:hypothetical protein
MHETPRDPSAVDRPNPPTIEGSRPRGSSSLVRPLAVGALVATLAAAGCSNSSDDQQTPPADLGMTSSIAPYYSDENLTIYEVQTPVALPVRKPTAADMSGSPPAGTTPFYTHAPYLLASDESVEVHYTISNLDDQPNTVWLLIDPWNEFVRWNPGITVVDDDVTVPNFGYDLAFVVPAKSRVEGTLTSDDFIEIATKLASVQKMLASQQAMMAEAPDAGSDDPFDPTTIANNIFNPQNRSNGGDPLYTPWIPPVIAGVTGFDLGLRTYDTAADVAIEITIDIVDLNGNRFVSAGSNEPQLGLPPQVLSPPAARIE